MKHTITVQQLINILNRVQLPTVHEVDGTPTTIRIDQTRKSHNIQLELINPGEQPTVDSSPDEPVEEEQHEAVVLNIFKPGNHENGREVDYVIRDITESHGHVMCISEQTEEDHFRVVINSGCVKYKKIHETQELLSWHIAECIIRTLVLHTEELVDYNRVDELVNLFYDKLDGVIDNR